MLVEQRDILRHVHRGRDDVVFKVCVLEARGLSVKAEILEQRHALCHDHTAVNLTFGHFRIDGAAHIVTGDHLQHLDRAAVQIDLDLRDMAGVGVSIEGLASVAVPVEQRYGVGAGRHRRLIQTVAGLDRLWEADIHVGKAHTVILKDDIIHGLFVNDRTGVCDDLVDLVAGIADRHAAHKCSARSDARAGDGGAGSVGLAHGDAGKRNAHALGRHFALRRAKPLAKLRETDVHMHVRIR